MMKRDVHSAMSNAWKTNPPPTRARVINFVPILCQTRPYVKLSADNSTCQCIWHATLAVQYLPYLHTGLLHVYFECTFQILGGAICDLTYQIIHCVKEHTFE